MSDIPITRYSAADAYPPIAVSGKNAEYASMLLADMAASKGEMTAIYQYMYQGWTFPAQRKELTDTLEHIAMVEMHHLDILGQLVTLLGGDPKAVTVKYGRKTPWDADMVRYDLSFPQLLKYDAELERAAYHTYLSQSEQIKDQNLSAMLRRIAADEHLHLQVFENLYQKYRSI